MLLEQTAGRIKKVLKPPVTAHGPTATMQCIPNNRNLRSRNRSHQQCYFDPASFL